MRAIKFKFVLNGKELSPVYTLEELVESCEPVVFTDAIITGAVRYTGLKDKNGKEIYEGDIVRFSFWWFDGNHCDSVLTGIIAYSDELMSFQLKGVKNKEWESFTGHENDSEYLTPFSELNFDDADFEIIGSIHENPELLDE